MVIQILFVVVMFLWFLAILPFPQTEPFNRAPPFLGFVAVLLLGIFLFMPGMR